MEAQYACNPTPRGIPVYTAQLIRHLLKRQANDYALTFFDKDKERNNRQYVDKYFGDFNVPLYECNSESYRTLMSGDDVYQKKSYNELTEAYGDVFHFMHFIPIPARLEGKMVVTVHDLIPILHKETILYPGLMEEKDIQYFPIWWEKLLEKQPTIVADSEATKRDIIDYYKYENVVVVPLGYNESIYYPDYDTSVLKQLNITTPYIMYCGAIDVRKNILGILEAFKEVANDIQDIKLVLVGKKEYMYQKVLLSKIENYKYKDRVIMPGFVSDTQKRVLMSNATAFLFPSFYEGFGLPLLEAMACGAPVITSNVSSLPEISGDAGILVDPHDALAIADAVKKVCVSEELQNTMRKNSLKQTQNFSWNKTAELMEKVYRLAVN